MYFRKNVSNENKVLKQQSEIFIFLLPRPSHLIQVEFLGLSLLNFWVPKLGMT